MERIGQRLRISAALLAIGGWAVLAQPGAAEAQILSLTAYKQAVAERLSENEGLAAFYRARDFEPIWTSGDSASAERLSAFFEALSRADAHGLPAPRYHADALLAQLASVRTERERGALEVALSESYLQFARDLQSGALVPSRVDSGIKRDLPRRDPKMLLEALAGGNPRAALHALAPQSPEYARLMRAKLSLEHLIAHGGWGPEVHAGKLEPGESGNAVIALRDRLTAMGYMAPSLSASYDGAMQAAVGTFQEDHGLAVDGVAGSATLSAINVSPQERLKSVIVAMERERWLNLPEGLGKRHILVNLTDFHARIIDDGKVSFETRSVVGAQASDRRTPEFSDVMEFMVINPSWYVPRSIVVNEYLPQLRRNPGAAGHLQITDSSGRPVNRANGFAQYSAASFPFAMRQPPGPGNALGQVKFMFPNKYNIYLHDTPSKNLFARDVRAFSHGCIRLGDPKDFAYVLLARQTDDPEGLFQAKLNSGAESRVNLEEPVPVHLIYRTAFTKAKGQVNYRGDIYGRDAALWDALSAAGVALAAGQS